MSEILDGEAVVLHLGTGKYFALNRTATRMWELLREHGESERVCAEVSTEFGAEPERVKADFELLVRELVARGLLHVKAT